MDKPSMDGYCCNRMAFDLNQSYKQHVDRADCPDALIARMRGGYHRSLGGSVTLNAMGADERAFAVAHEPWRWSLSPRIFARWPADRVRGASPMAARSRPSGSSAPAQPWT
jgi:hypothetical protein